MMKTQSVASLLEVTLKEMSAQAQQLVQIIHDEGKALRDADIEALNSIVQLKKQHLEALSDLDNKFKITLKQFNFTANDDIEQFLAEAQSDNVLLECWNDYMNIISECQALNLENNSLITVGIRHTSKALDFLLSSIGENKQELYGPQGQQHISTGTDNNFIAKA